MKFKTIKELTDNQLLAEEGLISDTMNSTRTKEVGLYLESYFNEIIVEIEKRKLLDKKN